MSDAQRATAWLDADAGKISATGRDCQYLAAASAQWAQSHWGGEGVDSAAPARGLAERLRVLTDHDERGIATCLTAASLENLLQYALVLCRLHHQSNSDATASGDTSRVTSRCLVAVGSDHGRGIVGRMASGRADSRSPEWPLVPGFTHAPLESLAERIDDTVAMVLVSPIDVHDRMQAISGDQLMAIREACDRHGACLAIDHSRIPPQGGGQFWVHEAIASITADAVIMSAGLTGGTEGGLLTLSERLAQHAPTLAAYEPELSSSSWVSAIAAATLDQWIEHSWCDVGLDELPTELAGRLAGRECVRDLHVTGRTIGIELDIPAAQWVKAAAEHQLGVATAGEFAVAMQPPLILSPNDIANLCDRVDQVFDWIELEEQQKTTTAPRSENLAPEESVLKDSDPEDSDLEDSDLEDSDLEDSDLEDSDLEDPDLEDPDLEDPDLEDPDLEDPDLEDSDPEDSDLEDSDLEDSDLEDSDLEEPDLEDSDLEESAPEELLQQTAGDSEYDVGENDTLDDDVDEELRPDEDNHSPAMNTEPEIQS